jgi:hypothetical protein
LFVFERDKLAVRPLAGSHATTSQVEVGRPLSLSRRDRPLVLGAGIVWRAQRVSLAVLTAFIGVLPLVVAPTASAKSSASAAVRTEYRNVALAEFDGPAKAVCSQLTPSGVRAYTRRRVSCVSVFATYQRELELKLGHNRLVWRREVLIVVARLHVTIHGRHASAKDPSGVFRSVDLVKEVDRHGKSHWKFSSAPPLPR